MEMMELSPPEPGPGELLARVRAAGVNPIDYKIRDGAVKVLLPFSFPLILGTDLAGDVEAIGPGVTKFRRGGQGSGLGPRHAGGRHAAPLVRGGKAGRRGDDDRRPARRQVRAGLGPATTAHSKR